MDVAVVGAGITGLSTAFHLAQRRLRVAVVDRVGPGAGVTAIQPGGVRQQWGSRVNCLLARESWRFYTELDERLGRRVDAVLEQGGYLFVAHSEPALARLNENRSLQNELGIPSESLSPDEAAARVPGLDPATLAGAVFCHQDGYFDRPQAVVAAFAEAARARGAQLLQGDVRALRERGAGWSLELADGSELHAGRVVVAAGYDSPPLLRPLGVELPIRKEPRHLFYSDPIKERLLEPLVVSPERHFAAKQLADGSVLASDLSAGTDPDEPEAIWRGRIRETIAALLPVLEYVSLPVHVEGSYDLTPDHQLLLGAVPGSETLWVAAGMSGRGFMLAPAIGRIVAEGVTGSEADEVLGALALDRFERENLLSEPQVV